MSSTANATAIGTRFVPKNEIVRAAKSRRKLRWRSAFTARTVSAEPPALRPELGLPERLVERRLPVGRLRAQADDQRAAELVRAGRELLRARAGHDDRA